MKINVPPIASSPSLLLTAVLLTSPKADAIEIVVDYTYDSNNFFSDAESRSALEEAAARFSRIITNNLNAVSPAGTLTGTSSGWRIGFTHPGTGDKLQISTATDDKSDPIANAGAPAADVYGFAGLNANEWILYAGGRDLESDGEGGTGSGINYSSVYDDIEGPYHRGVDDNTPSNSVADLPRWGGAISFDTETNWHYDLNSVAGPGEADFYTVALHEIGHALGLSASWNQLPHDNAGGYTGYNVLEQYNSANETSVTSLDLVSGENLHWADGVYDSPIFELGEPNLVGTVGLGNGQDLLMEPIANFSPGQMRLELTQLEAAALRDVGWTIIPEPSSLTLLGVGLALSLRRRR